MTIATASPARTTRPQKNVSADTAETLFQKIVERLKLFDEAQYERLKDAQYRQALAAVDIDDRRSLIKIYGYLGRKLAEQKELQAERERYMIATAPVREAWQAALDAWKKWVAAEKAKNPLHQAQLAIAREFWMRYSELDVRIASLWEDGPDGSTAIRHIVADIETLVSDVVNFYVGNWCPDCGVRIPEVISPRNGGKAFRPRLCVACKRAELALAEELAELEPVVVEKHHVKKPGSASRRSDGPRSPKNAEGGNKGQGKKGGKRRDTEN